MWVVNSNFLNVLLSMENIVIQFQVVCFILPMSNYNRVECLIFVMLFFTVSTFIVKELLSSTIVMLI